MAEERLIAYQHGRVTGRPRRGGTHVRHRRPAGTAEPVTGQHRAAARGVAARHLHLVHESLRSTLQILTHPAATVAAPYSAIMTERAIVRIPVSDRMSEICTQRCFTQL